MKVSFSLGRYFVLAICIFCFIAGCSSATKIINGATKWSKKTEKKPLEVHGAFGGDHLHLYSLTVHGSLNLKNSTVDHDLTVYGFATLEDVKIGGNITVNGLALKGCETKNIFIASSNEAVVKISGNTTIDGEVQFTRTRGVVHLSEDTNISGGIVNGSVEEAKPVKRTGPITGGKKRPDKH